MLTVPATAQGQPSLRRGSTGPAVRTLNARLNIWIGRNPTLGLAKLPINGVFGPATERTVLAFQRARGLPQVGIVGPRTWAQLPAVGEPQTAEPVPLQNRCDRSYPTLCIPVGVPDIDCPEIPQRRFPVVGADPHRFDGDNDGVGCER